MALRKIFVGSLPLTITGEQLREVFSKYGQVEETYVKPDCEPGRQWAFVTFATQEQAQYAKESCDRVVTFPGSERPSDVMLAKPRGGKGGYGGADYNTGAFNQPASNGGPEYTPGAFGWPAGDSYQDYELNGSMAGPSGVATATGSMIRKIFVGSLPEGITEDMLRAEFSNYGSVEDIFIKPNCEQGRQWAFVNFSSSQEALNAAQMANGIVKFPGCVKPCEVTLARNQGMFGQDPIVNTQPRVVQPSEAAAAYAASAEAMSEAQRAPKKIFVGSLPDGITDPALRAEFSKYGQIVDLFMKNTCEPGRHWAFITFATHEEAMYAKDSCDRVLTFPGAERPCEVTIARHQGMFGKDAIDTGYSSVAPIQYSAGGNYSTSGQQYGAAQYNPSVVEGPRKIFVGSIPDNISDSVLRAEFSKYGQIVDLFRKQEGCERNRQWAFVTFATAEQAAFAKESTDRVLLLPGSDRACEVMLAKNQGKFGQAPLSSFGAGCPADGAFDGAGAASGGGGGSMPVAPEEGQPPPPATPPPIHLTAWRMYRTASGIPYYHNSSTGITQWECPPDLQVPGQPPGQPPVNAYAPAPAAAAAAQQRYAPY